MEFAIFVWLTSFIPGIKLGIEIACLIVLAYISLRICHAAFNYDDYTKKYQPEKYQAAMQVWKFKWIKRPVTFLVLLYVIASALPEQKTMYLIAAGYASQKMVESEAAEKVVKIINLKLDEYLQEAEKELKK